MRQVLFAAAILAVPGIANADFEIESATTEENAVQFEISNSVFFGDVNNGEDASRHEVGIAWGVLNPWTTELSFAFSVPRGDGPSFDGIEWSNTIGLVGGEASVSEELAVAIYTSFAFDNGAAEDVLLTAGPTISYNTGSVELGLNTFVQVPLGGGNDPGFAYAFGAMTDVAQGVGVGFEAHGEIAQAFGNASDFDQQEHFLGPVVEVQSTQGEQTAEIKLGVFAGLTEATPTVAVSADVGFGF